jgi:microcystin-dependent protein
MASVTGKTSIKIDDLINDTIISGQVVDGHLLLENRKGALIDAGPVTGAAMSPLDFMPVGYIYMSVVSTSPATLFGGTWARIAQGRVLVGQDGTQTEFDTAEETGGEKTHTITSGEMPAHTHNTDHNHAAATSSSDGNHTHIITRKAGSGTSTGVVRGNGTASADGTTEAEGAHTHTVNLPAYTGSSGSAGGGTAMNNLQPYLVVYMWKRTA